MHKTTSMEHKTSKIKVFETTDYKRFRFVNGNRGINQKKVEKIIKEIENGNDILNESPILVNENGMHLDVKDGQHRFTVAVKLKRPVHYILKESQLSLYNVAKVNSNTERWKAQDFINCYVSAGNENYKQVDAFHKKYKVAIGVCLTLLTNGCQTNNGADENVTEQFQQGLFEVKKKKEATMLMEICKRFEEFPAWNSRSFIVAITRIIQADMCDFDILVKKFSRDPKKLSVQPNWKGYVNNLEIIYNFDNSKRRTII